MKGFVLVIDDDQEMREMVRDFLLDEGYQVKAYELASKAFEEVVSGEVSLDHLDLVVSDIRMPEMDGMELVARMKRKAPDIPVVLITAHGSIETAIEATRAGAYDYIVKPFKLSEFGLTIERAIYFRNLKKDNETLRTQVKRGWTHGHLIGKSKAMRSVFELVDRVATATANVLITGESGTGKEMVARSIHENGLRKDKPFVAINCTAIPDALLESELFGHIRGSFTGAVADKKGLFEEAEGGTIFLDEIGDLDLNLQAKLLRVIQERKIRPVGDTKDHPIDVRIVAATHKDLKAAIKDGRFREDLYYRLSVIPIMIPPLRHRREDIPLLAEHFVRKYAAANNSPVKGLSPEALHKLVGSRWEGNVRELENIIERIVVLSMNELVQPEEIPLAEEATVDDFFGKATVDLPSMEDLEKRYIQLVMDKTGGRKEKAAQILGINRRTLYRKEREYGLVGEDSHNPKH